MRPISTAVVPRTSVRRRLLLSSGNFRMACILQSHQVVIMVTELDAASSATTFLVVFAWDGDEGLKAMIGLNCPFVLHCPGYEEWMDTKIALILQLAEH